MRARVLTTARGLGTWAALLLLCLAFALATRDEQGHSRFLEPQNVLNVLRQISMNAIVAAGATFVILTGGIDISVGTIAAFAGTAAAMLMRTSVPLPVRAGVAFAIALLVLWACWRRGASRRHAAAVASLAMAAGLAAAVALAAAPLSASGAAAAGLVSGALAGAFNGLVVTRAGITPFIVTLATMRLLRGPAYLMTGGYSVFGLPPTFYFLGGGHLLGIPVPVLIMAAVFIGAHVLLTRTRAGRHLYAVGGNEDAARLSGVPVARVKTLAYCLSGALAGLAGILLASRLRSGQPNACEGWEFDAITAVVLGGTSLMGGQGSIVGTALGAIIIGVLNNGMNLLGVQSYHQYMIKGAVLLLAVLLDRVQSRVAAKP